MNHKIIISLLIISAGMTQAQTKVLFGRKDGTKDTIAVKGISHLRFAPPAQHIIEPTAAIDYEKEMPWSVAVDKKGNIFVSLTTVLWTNLGVVKITPEGVRTQVALKGPEAYFSSLKIGPGDTLYGARMAWALFNFDPSSVTTPKVYVSKTTSTPLSYIDDFDFDAQKNIWGGGNRDTAIYRIDRNKKTRAFSFGGIVRSLRYYQNALYVAAQTVSESITTEAVYRFPINAADTSLGEPVKYFDLSAQPGYSGNKITAITFDIDGKLYVGTDGAAGILVVPGQNAAPVPLNNGQGISNVVGFQWGPGSILYVIKKNQTGSRTPQVLLSVDMQTQSAPYYGRE
jgi:hypothetical protein